MPCPRMAGCLATGRSQHPCPGPPGPMLRRRPACYSLPVARLAGMPRTRLKPRPLAQARPPSGPRSSRASAPHRSKRRQKYEMQPDMRPEKHPSRFAPDTQAPEASTEGRKRPISGASAPDPVTGSASPARNHGNREKIRHSLEACRMPVLRTSDALPVKGRSSGPVPAFSLAPSRTGIGEDGAWCLPAHQERVNPTPEAGLPFPSHSREEPLHT